MSLRRLFTLGLVVACIPLATTLGAEIGQPVVTPWTVDNTPAQSQIRQYQRFRGDQSGPAENAGQNEMPAPYNYAGQAPSTAPQSVSYGNALQTRPSEALGPAPSALEKMYSTRIVENLEQFGYDMFGVPDEKTRGILDILASESPRTPSGAVQDDFVLGVNDELYVVFTGQRTDRKKYRIDSNGMLLIEDFPPIPTAGRTIGQVRISLEAAAAQLHNTQVHLSLSSVRQIGVLVVGHVKEPGRRTLTVFHTVLDALMESGGVDKTGSLRQIKLVRSGRATYIDLYSLLMHGATNMDLQLRDGDRLIIPPIGPTVAIAGEVKRPGIYEILPDYTPYKDAANPMSEKLSLNEMLDLAGGVLSPGNTRFLKLAVTPGSVETVEEVENAQRPAFTDGSILMISKGRERRSAAVELQGHTLRPGLHALSDNQTLSRLLPSVSVLGPDIYPLIGVIERWNEKQLTRQLIDFPLKLVLSKEFDRNLQEGDVVHLFSMAQIEALTKPSNPNAPIQPVAYGSRPPMDETENDILEDEVMAAFLSERSVFVRGAVRKPGAYPAANGLTLDAVLAAAGGPALEADTANIEITSAHNGPNTRRIRVDLSNNDPREVFIGPGDSVRLNQKFEKISDNSALILGEVQTPGRYDLVAGDKISDLLRRAGGLTTEAYPLGAIFSRESERKAEEMRFDAQADNIERSIATALDNDEEKVPAGKIAEARALAAELRNAQGVGRITVEADPGILAANPELDMLLQPGDRLYIPPRSLTVRVSGEVLSAASLQFREKKAPLDYIHEAGGFSFHADKDRSFVIYPDGAAQPLQVSSWNYRPIKIPPGSTIVVPRDPKPFDFIQSAKDISQILSNLAVTAIFVDDLRDN